MHLRIESQTYLYCFHNILSICQCHVPVMRKRFASSPVLCGWLRQAGALHVVLRGQGSLALLTVPVVYTFQLGGNQHAIMTKNCWHDLWAHFHLVNPQGQLD